MKIMFLLYMIVGIETYQKDVQHFCCFINGIVKGLVNIEIYYLLHYDYVPSPFELSQRGHKMNSTACIFRYYFNTLYLSSVTLVGPISIIVVVVYSRYKLEFKYRRYFSSSRERSRKRLPIES